MGREVAVRRDTMLAECSGGFGMGREDPNGPGIPHVIHEVVEMRHTPAIRHTHLKQMLQMS